MRRVQNAQTDVVFLRMSGKYGAAVRENVLKLDAAEL
jgi:hypothetical protein